MGKLTGPRCFKNFKTLSTKYNVNNKSCVTVVLFVKWIKELDRKMRFLKRKVILFIDQCPVHPINCDFLNLNAFVFSQSELLSNKLRYENFSII